MHKHGSTARPLDALAGSLRRVTSAMLTGRGTSVHMRA